MNGKVLTAIVLALAAAMLVMQLMNRGGAPTPELFKAGLTFNAAVDQARAQSKPALIVATASWCGPCQVYKRSTLADRDVLSQLKDRVVPALVDVDADPDAARLLKVYSIPATFVMVNGQVAAKAEGVLSESQLLALVNESSAPR
jgi:thioredoxin-like negative regulator of GroEL